MNRIHAGTSGWAYPAWKPAFYPAKLATTKFLGYYAGRLNPVEVNFTFRRFPTDFLYLRLRKPEYSRQALQRRVRGLAERGELYVYLNHEETPEGALLAESLLSPAVERKRE